jgi:hypothetical protein
LASQGFGAVVDRVGDGVELAAYRRHGGRFAGVGKIIFNRLGNPPEIR